MTKFHLDSINHQFAHEVDKYARMCAGMSTDIIAIEDRRFYLEVSLSLTTVLGYPRFIQSLAIEVTQSALNYIPNKKSMMECIVQFYFHSINRRYLSPNGYELYDIKIRCGEPLIISTDLLNDYMSADFEEQKKPLLDWLKGFGVNVSKCKPIKC